jgi:hypothetical protein
LVRLGHWLHIEKWRHFVLGYREKNFSEGG